MTKQILLVEDELILCDNYAKTIRENGYEVVTCHTKQQALEIINKHLPDLAILDIGLGDEMEAGFDLCREIRALELKETSLVAPRPACLHQLCQSQRHGAPLGIVRL